jgi:hypothetical protein
VFSLPT